MTGRVDVLGVGFDNLTMADAVDTAERLMAERRSAYVVTPNPEIVWLSRTNAALLEALKEAALVLPDGIGIVLGAKLLKSPLGEKLPGIDFALALMERMAAKGMSVYLFGSKEEVAEAAAEKLREKFPGLVIAGAHHGYFEDDAPIIEHINKCEPDLLIVCLGAPKQEIWMRDNAKKLSVGLMAGLGGSLDVLSGTVRRAPEIWQKLSLEWLYRLIKEPWRIRRMKNLPLFLFTVIGERLRGKNDAR